MIWLTWRDSRLKAASTAAVLVAFALLLGVTGPNLAGLYARSPIASCVGGPVNCGGHADDFLQQLFGNSLTGSSSVDGTGIYWLLYLLGIVVILVAPALIGIFWGAPLIAGEFETGTHYLAWNQSITRTRWLAVKLTLTGLSAMVVTEVLSLMFAWWATPINRAVAQGAVATPLALNQFSPLVFATRGITPVGYAAFGFALGVTVGMLVRRSIPAMALTLAIFGILQVAMPLWVRPQLFPPDHSVTTLSSWAEVDAPMNNGILTLIPGGWERQPEGWVLSTATVNTAGEQVSAIPASCAQVAESSAKAGHSTLLDCLSTHGIRIAVTYQPASRYWAFQSAETAIYVALAFALAGYCFWRLNRRLT